MNTNDNDQAPSPAAPPEKAAVETVAVETAPAQIVSEAAPHLSAESQIAEVQIETAPIGVAPAETAPQSTVEFDRTLNAPLSDALPASPVERAATLSVWEDEASATPLEKVPPSTVEFDRTVAGEIPPEIATSPVASEMESQNAQAAPVEITSEISPEMAAPETVALTQETPAQVAPNPVVPTQNPAPETTLRALFAGAFLGGEWEVREVLARGATNLYRVSGGDYSAPENKLLAERAALPQPQTAPSEQIPAPNSATSEIATAETAQKIPDVPPLWDDIALDSAGIAALPDAARVQSNSTVLVAPIQTFSQDERDYLLFDWFDSTSLQDWREPTNDVRLLKLLAPLAHFLALCDERGENAEISTETLRVDDEGALRFIGFTAPRGASASPQTPDANLAALCRITNFLLKHVVAESATMRLDDRYAGLALSEEVKELARRLDDDAPDTFNSVGDAAAAIEKLAAPVEVLDAALLSDTGRERDHNEDAGLIVRSQRAAMLNSYERELYIVSDGMGGHEGGEVASDLTLSSLVRNLDALQINWDDNVAVRASLLDVIDAVNAEVVALTETPKYRASRAKPGATLTFALRLGARVFLGNVGDSRAYIVRDGVLTRATKDHSYVQNLVDRGEITDDEAWEHPEGSIITAHIGYAKLKTRDVFLRLVRSGDRLVVVSDGVVDMLRDRDIAPHLQGTSAAAIVKSLVDASNDAGGADNITAICVLF